MKFKNWLIKKCGGYTKEEYEDSCINKEVFFTRTEKNIIPFSAQVIISKLDQIDLAKFRVAQMIAESMVNNNFVSFNVCRDEVNDNLVVRAKVFVREL